jgi:predicted HNH restriction endonuclease
MVDHLRRASVVVRRSPAEFYLRGALACEACGFDFEVTYGERGKEFIECHHVRPLSELKPGDKTSVDDLALVCSNCHRMIHVRRPWLTIEQLKQLITT